MKGFGHIYSFPFRVYGKAFLPRLEETDKAGRRFRLYPPFQARAKGAPLSPAVPFTTWPSFEWHPKLPKEERINPPQDLTMKPLGERAYDAIRLDGWGDGAERAMHEIVLRLFAWWRHLIGQPWIGSFESQTDPLVKGTFEIDDAGRALTTPWIIGKAVSPSPWIRQLDEAAWREAFSAATQGRDPPLHWQLWLDADNYGAQGQDRETVLSLALSVEIGRDTIFPRFAKVRDKGELGYALEAPFDGTDLLTHVDGALNSAIGRSLKAEYPLLFEALQSLYIARHHVAHGKRPLIREGGKYRVASLADVMTWHAPVREILLWMESLAAT